MTYKAEAPSKKSDQLGFRPKRFWSAVEVQLGDNGFEIHLDGRPAKTAGGKTLALPTRRLAQHVAAEWSAVGDYVDFADMPLTRLGFASVDRMSDLVSETLVEVLRYSETDLVCYPSQYPSALQARESLVWLPILDWAREALGLCFEQNFTLVHQPQPKETLMKVEALVVKMSAYERAGLMMAIPALGSVVLAFALRMGQLSGAAAFEASRIGETFQAETWGVDEEAALRSGIMKRQMESLDLWFRALDEMPS